MQTRAPSKVPGPSTSEREPCSFPRTGHNPPGLVGHADSIHCHPIVYPGVIRRSKRFIFVAKKLLPSPPTHSGAGVKIGKPRRPRMGSWLVHLSAWDANWRLSLSGLQPPPT